MEIDTVLYRWTERLTRLLGNSKVPYLVWSVSWSIRSAQIPPARRSRYMTFFSTPTLYSPVSTHTHTLTLSLSRPLARVYFLFSSRVVRHSHLFFSSGRLLRARVWSSSSAGSRVSSRVSSLYTRVSYSLHRHLFPSRVTGDP